MFKLQNISLYIDLKLADKNVNCDQDRIVLQTTIFNLGYIQLNIFTEEYITFCITCLFFHPPCYFSRFI